MNRQVMTASAIPKSASSVIMPAVEQGPADGPGVSVRAHGGSFPWSLARSSAFFRLRRMMAAAAA